MAYTEKNKDSIYKWRLNNPNKLKEQQKKDFRKYYLAHRQQIVERAKLRYLLKKTAQLIQQLES
jgi:hypothetical protein